MVFAQGCKVHAKNVQLAVLVVTFITFVSFTAAVQLSDCRSGDLPARCRGGSANAAFVSPVPAGRLAVIFAERRHLARLPRLISAADYS